MPGPDEAGARDDPTRPFVPALTAGGWRDMTRLARGDVAMGAGIAATNAAALAARIRDVRAVLDAWLADLDGAGRAGRSTRSPSGSEPPASDSSVSTDGGAGPRRPDGRALPDAASWYGLRTDGLAGFASLVAREGRLRPRAEMEVDPGQKQIIPYLVLRDGPRYFLMQRTRAGVDARLHDRYSIGVGGHLNPGDDGLDGGLRREWAEEVVADFVPSFELVALLNDDTTEVGAVHLGAVYVADAAGRAVDDPRDRQAHRVASWSATPWRLSPIGSRRGAGSCSNSSRRPSAARRPAGPARRPRPCSACVIRRALRRPGPSPCRR